jgi:hypothetical protein
MEIIDNLDQTKDLIEQNIKAVGKLNAFNSSYKDLSSLCINRPFPWYCNCSNFKHLDI